MTLSCDHVHSRRQVVGSLLAATAPILLPGQTTADPHVPSSVAAERARHETYMRLAIAQANLNPGRPFGSVIVDNRTGAVVGRGVVGMEASPMFHSEVVAMNDYIARHGNHGWGDLTMYGTGEPCPMCMSAMIWAGLPSVVYGSEIPFVQRYVDLIAIRAADVIAAAHPLYTSKLLLGGVLSDITDPMFAARGNVRTG